LAQRYRSSSLVCRVERAVGANSGFVSALSTHPRADYLLGSDRGSPNHGSTLASKRVTKRMVAGEGEDEGITMADPGRGAGTPRTG
jgi:hypothetical protein